MKQQFAHLVGVVSMATALGLCLVAYFTTHWYEYCSRNIQTGEHMRYYRGLWCACFEHEVSQTFVLDAVCKSFSEIPGETLTRQEKAIWTITTISLVGQAISVVLSLFYVYFLYRLLEQQKNLMKIIILLQGQSALFTFVAIGMYGRWVDLIAPQLPEQITYVIVMEGLSWSLVLAAVSGSVNMLSSIAFILGLRIASRANNLKPSGSLNQLLHATQYKSLPHNITEDEELFGY